MLKILMINDGSLHGKLSQAGDYSVIQAQDGWQAVNLFVKHSPDLIIVAMDTPEASLRAVANIRENRLPEARFLVLVDGNASDVRKFQRMAAVYGVRTVTSSGINSVELGALIESLQEEYLCAS